MRKKYPVRPPVGIREIYEKKCNHCGGDGQEPGLSGLTCRECFGRGRVKWRIEECSECGGKGKRNFLFACKTCQGRGWTQRDIG